jgi:hypothetical protein
LDRRQAVLSSDQFESVHRVVAKARAVFDLAREELKKHAAAHGSL